jgi:hypothetical protein
MKRDVETSAGLPARVLCLAGLILSLAVPGLAQLLQPTLSVNGSPLVTARPVTRIGEEWFLPLVPIAESLGVEISISPNSQELHARRQNGTEITYDGRTGQIRHGYVLVGQVKNPRQIQFAGSNEDFLFPLSGVVVLLGVDVEEDPQHSVLRIDSSRGAAAGQSATAPALSLTSLNYNYGLTTNMEDYSQSINLFGEGLARVTRLKGNVLFSRYPGQPVLNFSQGTLYVMLPKAREFVLGDQGAYSGIGALTATVRGVGIAEPVRGYQFNAYGGTSASATFGSLGGSFARYDTEIAGFNLRKKTKAQELSLGGHHFSGPDRQGTAIGFAYGRITAKNQFKSQILMGIFSGLSSRSVSPGNESNLTGGVPDPRTGMTLTGISYDKNLSPQASQPFTPARVDGPAFGITLNDTFNPFRQLSVSGQLDYYGRNFLTPRLDSRYNAQSNGALSLIFRPSRYASFTAGINKREYLVGDRDRFSGRNFGALATLPGRHSVQFGFFRSEQASSISSLGRSALTQFSLIMPSLNRYSAYVYYSEMAFAGVRARNLSAVFAVDLKNRGRITLNEQLQLHSGNRWGLDWYLDLPRRNGFIRLGIDRITTVNAASGFSPLVGIRLPLPHGHSLELTYYSDRNYRTLRVEIGGRLMHEPAGTSSALVSGSIMRRAPITGRVFLDENMNGIFDEHVDRPVADVQITLDNAQAAVTDARGLFRFEQIEPGAHTVQAGLEGLPADMIFSDVQERTMAVLPYRDNILNFSVVRTGRISGKVTYLDYSRNPEEPVERPLPDVRIIAGPQHDSFSELNGIFLIGDLPPGSYELKLDRETLPEGYAPKPPSIHVLVKPGNTLMNVAFLLVIPPKPVVQKTLPPQAAEAIAAPTPENAAAKENAPKAPPPEPKPQEAPKPSAATATPKPSAASPARGQGASSAKPTSASQAGAVRRGNPAAAQDPPNGEAGKSSGLAEQQSPAQATGLFQLQIDSAQTLIFVEERVKKLRLSGFSCRVFPVQVAGKGTWYRIRLVGYDSRESAVSAGKMLIARGLTKAYWVIR